MNEYWVQSVRRSAEREQFFTEREKDPQLAQWARESNKIGHAHLNGTREQLREEEGI